MNCHDEVGPYLGIGEQEIKEIGRDNVTERKRKLAILWECREEKKGFECKLPSTYTGFSFNE